MNKLSLINKRLKLYSKVFYDIPVDYTMLVLTIGAFLTLLTVWFSLFLYARGIRF